MSTSSVSSTFRLLVSIFNLCKLYILFIFFSILFIFCYLMSFFLLMPSFAAVIL